MKINVPFLNALVAALHILIIGIALYCLKLASRPLKKFAGDVCVAQHKQPTLQLNYNKLMALSWFKKYTLIGSFFESDKKYLLKQFLFVGAYAVTCLHVNTIILWPLAFSSFLVPCFFILFDVVLKKISLLKVDESATSKNKTANQGGSEIQIESVNIQSLHAFSIDRQRNKQSVKLESKIERNIFQVVALVSLTFAATAMLLQAVMVMSNSVSNSGQLNIVSLLAIISLDQLAVRITYGIIAIGGIKFLQIINVIILDKNVLVAALCQEEITLALIELEKLKQQKAKEITASPPRKKTESPSKVPQALPIVDKDKSTLLNLINFQPTKRRENSQIQQIYFTTQQKQMFEEAEEELSQSKSGILTKRNQNKQNQTVSFSAVGNKHTKATIAIEEQKKGYDDIVILKNDPLEQNGEFYFQSPYNQTRRKKAVKRKNKRNLNLTGNSPYLEYLPDMLKKVDKYKNAHRKDQKVL